jgi:hypothetical protein
VRGASDEEFAATLPQMRTEASPYPRGERRKALEHAIEVGWFSVLTDDLLDRLLQRGKHREADLHVAGETGNHILRERIDLLEAVDHFALLAVPDRHLDIRDADRGAEELSRCSEDPRQIDLSLETPPCVEIHVSARSNEIESSAHASLSPSLP